MANSFCTLARTAVFVLGVGSAVCIQAQSTPSVDTVLRKLVERPRGISYTSVQQFQSLGSRSFSRKIRLEMDRSGTSRSIVLEPLTQQGTISIDDTKLVHDYLPDTKQVFEYASQRRYEMQASKRAALMKQNYTFEMLKGSLVAGRQTYFLAASPKNAELPARNFWLDRKTMIVLRANQEAPDGSLFTTLDTFSIQYSTTDVRTIRVPTTNSSWRETKVPVPVDVKSIGEANKLQGMDVRMPKKLPLGFVPYIFLCQRVEDKPILTSVLTDGISLVILHTVRRADMSVMSGRVPDGTPSFTARSMVFFLVNDLPAAPRQVLLRSFIDANSGSR